MPIITFPAKYRNSPSVIYDWLNDYNSYQIPQLTLVIYDWLHDLMHAVRDLVKYAVSQ